MERLAGVVGVAQACSALSFPRSTFYRWRKAAEAPQQPDVSPTTRSPRRLSEPEEQKVLDLLHSERFVDAAPAQVWATLLDEGIYLCSERTMYRLLERSGENRERRAQLEHPPYEKPELLASGPNQVWSWDVTKLLGPKKWTYFYLFVVLDIFSRYVVGWMVAEAETAALGELLLSETIAKHEVDPTTLTIHADRGVPMTSKLVAQLYADLGVTKTHSRPYTSNDNCYSEAQFKTLKYRPGFPQRFTGPEHAKSHCRAFFPWYNDEHRHSGIGLMTPKQVHYGEAVVVTKQRQRVLDAAFAANPERFPRGRPRAPVVPMQVWINPPLDNV